MTTNTTMPEPQSQAAVSTYQKLRGHLAVLKLDAAAEA
ncbi:IS21-like element helper ATPase IstB, partial [Gordonia paraffinivorans]